MVMFGMIICCILTGLLLKKINRLTKLEFTALWLLTSLLTTYYVASASDILELFNRKQDALYLTFQLGQLILLPSSILFFLNLFHRLTAPAAKVTLFLLWIVLSVSGERILEQLGFFDYVDYPLWLSLSFWSSLLVISLGANLLFRHLLSRRDTFV